MKATYCMALGLALLARASPAPNACPQNECLTGVGNCGEVFSTCWDQCTQGTEPPRITPPACTATPVGNNTTPPDVTAPPNSTAPCWPVTACMEGTWECGIDNGTWGGCYDVCTGTQPTSPSCGITPMATLTTTSSMTVTPQKSETRGACKFPDEPWRCAPKGW
ncbi:hypothetical protein K491DRAFT_685639 [Lophiostoma macrostomum CBS 122681]|uniref:Uncharacterized protein n=1 Tax=Lophiostoma macrostomum CBS 122681 TaxID=1314788 RepID=A0A6A6SJY8_9PLEO|nr:hypothetical protein K491DRAFT_685639 [Lophiostoma macrostomum CBS 122681]